VATIAKLYFLGEKTVYLARNGAGSDVDRFAIQDTQTRKGWF
jgi:hypothetical protein